VVSYQEYHDAVVDLARKIDATGWKPNQVIGIMRGAAMAAVLLSEYWQTPCAFLAIKSRGQSREQLDPGGVFFERSLVNNASGFGQNALLVDDLSDSGFTLDTSYAWLLEERKHVFKRLRTAMVFYKTGSKFIPDFFAMEIKSDPDGTFPWIIQPWEIGFQAKEDPTKRG
jgi:hypothetical protein